ncbi:hypothetical protein ANRL2_04625 [Anaerolineae bacterium]|nr:hypothetical protein ANRL2_04625 [Anaerolineae bacterium]
MPNTSRLVRRQASTYTGKDITASIGLRYLRQSLGLAALVLVQCRSATGPDALPPIAPATPRQAMALGAPRIVHVADPDSSMLYVTVDVPDSSFSLEWRPSILMVESSRGTRDTVLMVPESCLSPLESGGSPWWQHEYEWYLCDSVVLLTDVPLTDSRIASLSRLVTGSFAYRFVLPDPLPLNGPYPGVRARYTILVPPGLKSTAEAMRRLLSQPETVSVGNSLSSPLCVASDDVPPPACPPWRLRALLRLSYSESPGLDSVAVAPGGWVRVSYADEGGEIRSTTYTMP